MRSPRSGQAAQDRMDRHSADVRTTGSSHFDMKRTIPLSTPAAIVARFLICAGTCLALGSSTLAETPGVRQVARGKAARVKFDVELITDTAGNRPAGGVGRSCWGFNQSNLVRHGENIYAMCWRNDQHLVVFHRGGSGRWQARAHRRRKCRKTEYSWRILRDVST